MPLRFAPCLVLWSLLTGLPAEAGAAEPECRYAVGEATTRTVFEALRQASEPTCRLESVDTARHRIDVRWTTPQGERRASIWPAPCAPEGARAAGATFMVSGDPCEAAVASLAALEPDVAVGPEAPNTSDAGHAEPDQDRLEALYTGLVLPGLWLAFFALAVGVLARRWRARPPPRLVGLLPIAAITALALVLRLALGTFSQGDLWDNTQDAYDPRPLDHFDVYGRAPEALLKLLFVALPASHDTFIAVNVAASVAAVPLLMAFTRRLGFGAPVAHVAALLLAVSPLHVRFASTTNRYMLLLVLVLSAWVLLLGWLERRRHVTLVMAALALGLAVQTRPEAIAVPLFTAALVVAVRLDQGRGSLRGAARGLLLAAAAWGLIVALPLSHGVSNVAEGRWTRLAGLEDVAQPLFDPAFNAFLSPLYTPWPWIALAVVGLTAPPRRVRWRRAWLAGTALAATWLVSRTSVDVNLWATRYHLLPLPLYYVLAAAALGWLRRPRAQAGAGLALALTALLTIGYTTRETTESLEYRFIREQVRTIPDACRIYTYVPGLDAGLAGARSLSLSSGRGHIWVTNGAGDDPPKPACRVLYVAANCDHRTASDEEERDQERWCRRPFREGAPEPLATTVLPRRPSVIDADGYRSREIPVGFYRLPDAPRGAQVPSGNE